LGKKTQTTNNKKLNEPLRKIQKFKNDMANVHAIRMGEKIKVHVAYGIPVIYGKRGTRDENRFPENARTTMENATVWAPTYDGERLHA